MRDPSGAVVISGAGALGPFGLGVDLLRQGMLAGRPALSGGCSAAVRDPIGPGPFPAQSWRRLDRASRMAALAASEALASAGLDGGSLGGRYAGAAGDAIGVVLGTMSAGTAPLAGFLSTLFREGPEAVSPMDFPFTVQNAPAAQCSILLGLRGPNLTICRMEASGLSAIATAAALVREGHAEAVLAGGVDAHAGPIEAAWERWGIRARGGAGSFRGPFDRRRHGFAPGEGSYVLLLEDAGRARRRGARPWAVIAGSAAAHAPGPAHRWPSEIGAAAGALRQALARAALAPGAIGCVVASANASPRLDAFEARALREALGPDLARLPVTSVKGAVGESGAASACAALVAAIALRDGLVPPVAGLVDPDPSLGLDCVRHAARPGRLASVLVNALGTGGTCQSLVLTCPPA